MTVRLAQPAMTAAIRHAVAEARLAYFFNPGSYTIGAFNAALAVAKVHERETGPDPEPDPDWVALYLEHHREPDDRPPWESQAT